MKIAIRQWLRMEMGMVGGVCFFLLVFMFALPGFAPAQDKYPAKSIIDKALLFHDGSI